MSAKNNTIQQKIAKLDEMLAWFNSDAFELEQAIERFKEAGKLADDIEHDLMELKNTITVVGESFDRDADA